MARKKKKTGKVRRVSSRKIETELDKDTFEDTPSFPSKQRKSFFSKRNIILFAILVVAALLWRFKGSFIAATVNGQPISRWELNDVLTRRFGEQTLDNIINERLILAAARQKGIFVTSDEINNRVGQIEGKLEGQMSLNDALAAQGLTENMFKRQIEIQVSIEKLFENEATVSSEEVEDYIQKNASLYKSATDPAQVREEVTSILKQQKLGELFDTWFADIRKNASINKYL